MSVSNGEYIKAAFEATLPDGTIAQNVFNFRAAFTSDQANSAVLSAIESYVEDIYDAMGSYITSTIVENLGAVNKMTWDTANNIWATGTLVGYIQPSLTLSGAGDLLPNQIAPVLVANTTRPKSRGRKFLMGVTEGLTQGTDLVSAALTALGVALAHYIADETISAGNDLIVGVLRDGVNQFLDFTDGEANSLVGTQRRRKPNVGI